MQIVTRSYKKPKSMARVTYFLRDFIATQVFNF
jgi:hypothetical protein